VPRRQVQDEQGPQGPAPVPRATQEAGAIATPGILIVRPLDILVCSSDRLLFTALQATAPGHFLRWATSLDGCPVAIAIERPDVVVLDLEAVSRPGYIRLLQEIAPRLPVALWVHEVPVEWAAHALDDGLLGIFLRSSEPAAVFRALARVAKGERAIDPTVLIEICRSRAVRVREREMAMAAMAERLSSKEIAFRLGCTADVVKRSLHCLYSRLGVRGRPQLATLMHRNYGPWHGILPLPNKLVIRGPANQPTA
jgi:DNA-binding NarL/FixJ family response regulator